MQPEKQEGPVPPRQEASLLNRRTLVIAGGVLVALIVIIQLLAAGILVIFNLVSPPQAGQLPAAGLTPTPPAEPRLQVEPDQDIQVLQATERAHLTGYAWLDQETGVVRIPIERAMQLVVERGLPVATSGAPPAPRIEADEGGFPHPTLLIQGTPGPRGTPLLELTSSLSETAQVTQTGTPAASPTQTMPAASTPAGAAHNDIPGSGSHLEVGQLAEVRFDQQLGNQLPLDLSFKDETGRDLPLKKLFGRGPVILVFADFDCEMLCPVILNYLAESLDSVNLGLGEQYQVISVGLDPADSTKLAAARKSEILSQNSLLGGENGWRFLTGDAQAISQLARVTGFQYIYDQSTDQFAHPTGLVILSSEGRIARYLAGLEYSSNDLRLSLVEASAGKIGAPIDRFFLMCYAYDPVRGRYTLAITRGLQVAGVGTVLALLAGVWILIKRERNGVSLVPGTGLDGRRPG